MDRVVLVCQRLFAIGQANDAQASVSEADTWGKEKAVLIGTAMNYGLCHGANPHLLDGATQSGQIDHSRDAAHGVGLLGLVECLF